MDTQFPDLEGRLAALLADSPARIPVLVGPCGSGRTTALRRLAAALGGRSAQYVDFERITSTPERFFDALTRQMPFRAASAPGPVGPADALTRALRYFCHSTGADGAPAVFLIDEVLELATFDHFPGLRGVVAEALAAFARSENRFVLASKFTTRMLHALKEAPDRFLVVQMPPVPAVAVAADLMQAGLRSDSAEEAARVIVQLADGRPAYCAALSRALGDPGLRVHDPIAALAALMGPSGEIALRCRYSYEIRLHRARGYGALKGALDILANEEPLNLTEIALDMGRTPGSTKDYLGWLENVDLVQVHRKRYTISDPMLRLWIRLYSGCDRPADERIAEEVQRYTMLRLSAPSD
jgi:hypothetical protein